MKPKLNSLLFLCALSLLVVAKASAQFSAGAELGLPMGNFSDVSNTGLGVSLRYEANIQDKLNWTASIGYLSFGGKPYLGGSFGNVSAIPLAGGIKYYLNKAGDGLYLAGDLGINFISYSVAFPNQGSGNGVTFASANTTRVGLSPGVGYRIKNWDFTGRFNLVSDFTYLGLRAAYVF